MLILLPPSESKAIRARGAAVRPERLSAPSLGPHRARVAAALSEVSALDDAAEALGVSASLGEEISRNTRLRTAPALPARELYTGVLYDALDVRSLTRAQRARADRRLAVGSALFGVVRGTDRIPAYRLSAGSALPGLPTLRTLWRPALGPVLAGVDELVVDLRSGSYAALAPVPGAVTLEVLSERPDGTRAVVSHFNKAHKGRVARLLATTTGEPGDVVRLRALLRRAGFHVEHAGGTALTLVVPAGQATR